ncbi:MAG: VOC family protein [Steroidobacteraceae bacterium]|nr:VOC family protein [Steroidobacteraceae bacterium]MDW8258667.1 VOC family protein [Gammaproteobacteria bacterium]
MSADSTFKRVTLWVRDAERSLRLYRDVLGLTVIEDKRVSGTAIAKMVRLQEVQLRIVHLARPGATSGWLGLYEIGSARPPLAPDAASGGFPRYGQTTLVFTVDAVPQTLERLRGLDLQLVAGPTEYDKHTPGEATPPGRYREAICLDPDGIPLSLIDYRPLA